MNAETFAQLFDDAARLAVSPMFALSIGAMLLLLAGIVPVPRAGRYAIVAATLLAAAVQEVRIFGADPAPGVVLGGTLTADGVTAAWGLVFLAATAIAWMFSLHYYSADKPFQTEHDVLVLTTPIGMMMMAGAQDLMVFFIGLELLSIPLYALAAFRRSEAKSVEAGLKYFLLGAFSAGFFLYGSALLYTATGTVSFEGLRAVGAGTPTALAGVALIVTSLFFKVSVFPFHLWVPDVYQGSPTPVTALMATGTKAAAFAFLLNAAFLLPGKAAAAIGLIAVLTMAAGNLGALVQTDVKRMLAYSGIAHAGTALLVIAGWLAGDPQPGGPVEAALFYMAAYTFTAGGAFGLLAWLEHSGEGEASLDSLRGLAQRRPYAAAGMTLFLLSLGGIPATGGFLGKYLVFSALVRADMVPLAVVGVLFSVIALGYYLRVIVAMYMQDSEAASAEGVGPSDRGPATIAASVCAALVLAMGVLPGWFLDRM